MTFDLFAQPLQRFAEEFLYFAAPQADHVRVLLLHAGLVVVLIPGMMHQIQLVHKAAVLQHFQSAVYRHAVELGVFFFGQLEQAIGIQVLSCLIDQLE